MPAQENITVSPRAPRSVIPRYFLRKEKVPPVPAFFWPRQEVLALG